MQGGWEAGKGQERSKSLILEVEVGVVVSVRVVGMDGSVKECQMKVYEKLYAAAAAAAMLMRDEYYTMRANGEKMKSRGENCECWGRKEWKEVKKMGKWTREDVKKKKGKGKGDGKMRAKKDEKKEKKAAERVVAEYYHRWCY